MVGTSTNNNNNFAWDNCITMPVHLRSQGSDGDSSLLYTRAFALSPCFAPDFGPRRHHFLHADGARTPSPSPAGCAALRSVRRVAHIALGRPAPSISANLLPVGRLSRNDRRAHCASLTNRGLPRTDPITMTAAHA
jgi:hypothetical protein